MTTLFSSISGQFGKIVLLGTLFPVLIITILNVIIGTPLLPFVSRIQAQLSNVVIGDDKWSSVTLLFMLLTTTGFLYNLNIPIIRIYEGYPWRKSLLGKLLSSRKKRRFREAIPLRYSIRYLRRELNKLNPDSKLAESLKAHQDAIARYINSELPDREDLVLPTQLGNVIRCFERYSNIAYGIDAIVLWPRLISKIESAFAGTIDEAKTSFDFMLNSSFLSTLTGLGIIAIGLSSRAPFRMASTLSWIWQAALFLTLSFIFYRFAIGRAQAWGMQVKAAFDLYRFDLLKALGYQQLPLTYYEEQALWQQITVQLRYVDSKESLIPIPYKSTPTRVVASPIGIHLEVKKRLTPISINGYIEIELSVKNKDNHTANSVTLFETLPEGYKCLLQSIRTSAGPLRVSNLNPLELALYPIRPQMDVIVKYLIKPVTA